MDGFTGYPPTAFGPRVWVGDMTFRPNGSSAVTNSQNAGMIGKKVTVARSSAGIYTVTLPAGMAFPQTPTFLVTSRCADTTATHRFETYVESWTNATRVLQLRLAQSGTLFDPPSNANNVVHVLMIAVNSSGL